LTVKEGKEGKTADFAHPSLVTLAVSASVFEILTLKAGKSLKFHTLPFFEIP